MPGKWESQQKIRPVSKASQVSQERRHENIYLRSVVDIREYRIKPLNLDTFVWMYFMTASVD